MLLIMEMFDCPFGILSEQLGTPDWKGRKGSSSHIPGNRSPRAATWCRRVPRASPPHPTRRTPQRPLRCWSCVRKQNHNYHMAHREGRRGGECVTKCVKLQWVCLGKFGHDWLKRWGTGALYHRVSQPIGFRSAALCWAILYLTRFVL